MLHQEIGNNKGLAMTKRTVLRLDKSLINQYITPEKLFALAIDHGADPANIVIQQEEDLAYSNQTELFTKRFAGICGGAKFYLSQLAKLESCPLSPIVQNALLIYITQLEFEFNEALLSSEINTLEARKNLLQEKACLLVCAFAMKMPCRIIDAIHVLSKAEEYHLLATPRDEIMTLIPMQAHQQQFYILQSANQLPALSDELLDEYWRVAQKVDPLPEWYQCLQPMEQVFLSDHLKRATSKDKIPELFTNFSSRFRTIPGLANFRQHNISLLDANFITLLENGRLASSMISSRDLLKSDIPQRVRDHHTQTNINHIVNTGLSALLDQHLSARAFSEGDTVNVSLQVMLQTLISPTYSEAFQPDAKLYQDKMSAIKAIQAVHKSLPAYQAQNSEGRIGQINLELDVALQATNHPLNGFGRLAPTPANCGSCLSFIADTELFLNENPEHQHADDIQELLEDYRSLLQLGGIRQANLYDENKRELFLSSLEQVLCILQGNLSYGSCVSGKDRKALELMHTDAILLYHRLYGHWPHYEDDAKSPARVNFRYIFSQLYLSHHHHCSAELNAPGSQGIKFPDQYLPQDIAKNLQTHQPNALIIDDALASFNELRSIISFGHAPDFLLKKEVETVYEPFKTKAESELWYLEITAAKQLSHAQVKPNEVFIRGYLNEIWKLVSVLTTSSNSLIKDFWDSKTGYGLNFTSALRVTGLFQTKDKPKGVKHIGQALIDTAGIINSDFLSSVHRKLKEREQSKKAILRYPHTERFYTVLSHLVGRGDRLKEYFDVNELSSIYEGLCQLYQEVTGSFPEPIDLLAMSEQSENSLPLITVGGV